MSFLLPTTLPLRYRPHRSCCCSSSPSSPSGYLEPGVTVVTKANTTAVFSERTKEQIRELFNKVQLSVSSYDTAWVAMVPSPYSSGGPCFPGCIEWLLDNQLSDGSWGLPHHPLLVKDALSSTLASVLALKRWGVGEEQVNKGLHFIGSNVTSATDECEHSPIGFDIIFPGMVKHAKDLDLNLPFEPKVFDAMHHRRELELRRAYSEGRKSYLAYISEGMGKLQDWEMAMKYQRKNGSLFNCPSSTAAAFMHLQDTGCLNYLHSLLEEFGNAVPTVHPLDILGRLCMVDNVERLGIERHFRQEIKSVLDYTYRCWLRGDEEIFLDTATCAMAFRILRFNGYDVSSDPLTQITEGKHESSFSAGHLKHIGDALELYRASEIIIYPHELTLEEQHSWSSHFLKEKLNDCMIYSDRFNKYVSQEVDDALKFPFHANLERATIRRNIEHYYVDSTTILKTSYCSSNIRNEDFLNLAVEDFNICQSIHHEELKYLERWVAETRLDKLKFARQKTAYCYFSAAATLFSPELYDARISWAKNGVLTTVVDDFFDIGGSLVELENLIQLVEKWDVNLTADCCSEHVQIIFSALHSTICEIGAKAFTFQGRNVTTHWLDLLHSMWREAKWTSENSLPTLEEYMSNGVVSFALGPIVLPTLYLVGPILSDVVVSSSEYQNLFKIMGTSGRLLNDIRSFERESKEGKLNAVSLHMIHSSGAVSAEESTRAIKSSIVSQRRELLRLVLETKSSMVPRACKNLFWNMSRVLNLFYMKDDGFTSHDMIHVVKAILHEPLSLSV
ncbi:ent-kaurene synthase, chloroplastic isoform X2 [Rhododendron vialii]|uniref:ent-kaurene synthase, chloroplastic isoform X2 n=1 Tax=Rhododendron vialii TaxID=182163 RepID=UPI00265E1B46|nr:ent-kaurene synthase, chloroplastic isoform X2 [Rhododendron vialii]